MELARSAEELVFGLRHPVAVVQFQLNEPECAYHVRKLEELVFLRENRLGELDSLPRLRLECGVKEIRYRCLPAIVIYLYLVERLKPVRDRIEKVGHCGGQSRHHLLAGVHIPLVQNEAVVLEIRLSCEGHHAVENPVAERPVHERERAFLPNERPCMETDICEAQGTESLIEVCGKTIYRLALVMKDEGYDVVRRIIVRVLEAPGFIDKHAQCLFPHGQIA